MVQSLWLIGRWQKGRDWIAVAGNTRVSCTVISMWFCSSMTQTQQGGRLRDWVAGRTRVPRDSNPSGHRMRNRRWPVIGVSSKARTVPGCPTKRFPRAGTATIVPGKGWSCVRCAELRCPVGGRKRRKLLLRFGRGGAIKTTDVYQFDSEILFWACPRKSDFAVFCLARPQKGEMEQLLLVATCGMYIVQKGQDAARRIDMLVV